MQRELRRLQEEQQTQQEKWQQLLVELRGQLLDRSREVEELRLQVKLTADTSVQTLRFYVYCSVIQPGDDPPSAGAAQSSGAAGDGGSSQRALQPARGGAAG